MATCSFRATASTALASLWLFAATSAHAQMYGHALSMRPPQPVYELDTPSHPMPPREAVLMLHHYGFRHISLVESRSETYHVLAVDRAGLPVMITLDAFDGDILSVHTQGSFGRRSALPRVVEVQPMPPQRPTTLAVLPKPKLQPQGPAVLNAPAYPPAVPQVLRGLAGRKP